MKKTYKVVRKKWGKPSIKCLKFKDTLGGGTTNTTEDYGGKFS